MIAADLTQTRAFQSVREFISAIETDPEMTGQIRRIGVEVDKDWEIAAILRTVIQTRPKEERPGLVFERVGGHQTPVAVGLLINRTKYAFAIGTGIAGIFARWTEALRHPIPPVLVDRAPCQENAREGNAVNLEEFPIPVWTPGHDVGPYVTAGCIVTKHPETGERNVGTYRMQVKGRDRTGVWINPGQHIGNHYELWERLNRPMPMAVAIGVDPSVSMTAVAKVPYRLDEYAVSGGLRGAPLEITRCKTVDLEVPAHAEVVLEGEVLPHVREQEGPFGEMSGFVPVAYPKPIFQIRAVTFRNTPIWQGYVSQKPPSESTNIRGISSEAILFKQLTCDLGFEQVVDVHLTESSTAHQHLIVQVPEGLPRPLVKQILLAAGTISPRWGKIVTVVDDDVDIRDAFEMDWALSFRMRPDKDVMILPEAARLPWDPATYPPGAPPEERGITGKMLINATKKWKYEPVALPKAEYLERARARWAAYGI